MTYIAQALHGYREGHRLLASVGDLSSDERAALDRLSDLSGYLPDGVDFAVYHTGYPCGRYYALAATWLDRGAARGGAVTTHTLLVPPAVIRTTPDPWALTALHRQPAGDELTAYRVLYPLSGLSLPATRPPPPSADSLVAFFGQPDRPVLHVADDRPSEPTRRLWALLWPEARVSFSFCTLALRPLSLDRRPFDLLGVPPAARNAFHALARSRGWWTPQASSAADPPAWITRLQRDGAEPLVERWQNERSRVRPEQIPLLIRLEELGESASQRLAAARSRADLLARLDPDGTHPFWTDAIEALIELQPQAAAQPKPLFDLIDLLGRPQLPVALGRAAHLRERLGDRLAEQIAERVQRALPETAAALPRLVDAATPTVSREAALAMVERAVSNHPQPSTCAAAIVGAAARAAQTDLAVAALRALKPSARRPLVEAAGGAAEWTASVAAESGDIELLPLTFADPVSFDDLRRLARAWASVTSARRSAATRIVNEIDPETIVGWALGGEGPLSAAETAIVQSVLSPMRIGRMTLEALAQRCEGEPRGLPVFEAAAADESHWAIKEALRHAPGLVVPALESRVSRIREAGVLHAPAAALCNPALVERVAGSGQYAVRERLLKAITASALADPARWPAGRVALTHRALRERLLSMTSDALFAETAPADRRRHALPFFAQAARHLAGSEQPTPTNARVVAKLLQHGFEPGDAGRLDAATDDLLAIMGAHWRAEDRRTLASMIAHAVRLAPGDRAWELLKVTFADLHRAIRKQTSWTIFNMWPRSQPKDASEWERWLVGLGKQRGWDRAAVLACAGDSNKAHKGLVKAWRG